MPYSRSSVEVLPDVGINASLPPSGHVLEKIRHIFVPAGREKEGGFQGWVKVRRGLSVLVSDDLVNLQHSLSTYNMTHTNRFEYTSDTKPSVELLHIQERNAFRTLAGMQLSTMTVTGTTTAKGLETRLLVCRLSLNAWPELRHLAGM